MERERIEFRVIGPVGVAVQALIGGQLGKFRRGLAQIQAYPPVQCPVVLFMRCDQLAERLFGRFFHQRRQWFMRLRPVPCFTAVGEVGGLGSNQQREAVAFVETQRHRGNCGFKTPNNRGGLPGSDNAGVLCRFALGRAHPQVSQKNVGIALLLGARIAQRDALECDGLDPRHRNRHVLGLLASRDLLGDFSIQNDFQDCFLGGLRVEGQPLVFAIELEAVVVGGLETDSAVEPLSVDNERGTPRHCVVVGLGLVPEIIEYRPLRLAQAQVNVLAPVKRLRLRADPFDRFVVEARIDHRRDRPALVEKKRLGFVIHAVVEDAGSGQLIAVGQHVRPMHVGQPKLARVCPGLVGRKADGNHARGMAGNDLAAVAHAVAGITHCVDPALKVQFAPVLLRIHMAELEQKIAKSLVPSRVLLVARPERFLVEHDPLKVGLAKQKGEECVFHGLVWLSCNCQP